MKSLFIFLALLLICLPTSCQGKCKDIIYPLDNEKFIFNCCIYQIKNGIQVYYTKNGDSAMIMAMSIIKDGKKFLLSRRQGDLKFGLNSDDYKDGQYKGYDYEHYQEIFKGATIQRNIGIAMTVTGLALEIAGLAMSSTDALGMPYFDEGGQGLFWAGIVIRNIGIPLWLSGGIKRSNNRRVMDNMEMKIELSFGSGMNGIDLRVSF